MERYKLIIENPAEAYILDEQNETMVCLCNTKRPDLEFDKLKELINKANESNNNIKPTNNTEIQQFQLGDTVYMIDEDYEFFESEVCIIELDNGKYYYTADWDFENGDIGKWVFKSEIERKLHLEALSGI